MARQVLQHIGDLGDQMFQPSLTCWNPGELGKEKQISHRLKWNGVLKIDMKPLKENSFFSIPEIEPQSSCMLDKHFPTKLHHKSFLF